MRIGIDCYECLLRRNLELARLNGDNEKSIAFLKDVFRVFAEAPENASSPYFSPIINGLKEQYFGTFGDTYAQDKRESNAFMLARIDTVREKIFSAPDPMYAALQFARLGNYLDFGALGRTVSYDALDSMLQAENGGTLDAQEYQQFLDDLKGAKSLLYILDNAGEIVIDRVVVELLLQQYPNLSVTVSVRGKPILNDALMEDAQLVGLHKLVPVISSESGLGGTDLASVGRTMKAAVLNSDIVFAKGMGNFETLAGCKLNIYYLFLCKCIRFEKLFDVPHLTGMFLNELRLPFDPENLLRED
ncbi:MAG: ARMT1-like domain-containing protein [Clostridia bacterium]|nr:ARMT1-like domain-containing protein [Clostridia bacterium]